MSSLLIIELNVTNQRKKPLFIILTAQILCNAAIPDGSKEANTCATISNPSFKFNGKSKSIFKNNKGEVINRYEIPLNL